MAWIDERWRILCGQRIWLDQDLNLLVARQLQVGTEPAFADDWVLYGVRSVPV